MSNTICYLKTASKFAEVRFFIHRTTARLRCFIASQSTNFCFSVTNNLSNIKTANRAISQLDSRSAAYRFFELSNIIPTAFVAVVVATLSQKIQEKNWRGTFWGYFACSVGLAAAAGAVLQGVAFFLPGLLLTEAFGPSQPLLRVLSLTLLFLYPNYLLTSTVILAGHPLVNAFIAAGGVVFNIGANLYAIPRWGAFGAAATTFLTEGLIFLCTISFLLYTGWRQGWGGPTVNRA